MELKLHKPDEEDTIPIPSRNLEDILNKSETEYVWDRNLAKEYLGIKDKDVRVVLNYREERVPGNILGHYDPESQTIVLYPKAIQKHGGSLYKTFIHELQHHEQFRRLLSSFQDRDISEMEAYRTNIDP